MIEGISKEYKYILILLLAVFVANFSPRLDSQGNSCLFVNVILIFFVFFYVQKESDVCRIIILGALGLRLLIFGVYLVLNSWSMADTDCFYMQAVLWFSGEEAGLRTGYDKFFLPMVFKLFGTHISTSIMANIIIGILAIIRLEKCLNYIGFSHKIIQVLVCLFAFNPFMIQQNVLLLRDSLVYWVGVFSFFCFMKYVKEEKERYMLFATIIMSLGMMIHSSLIVFLLVFWAVWGLVNVNTCKLKVDKMGFALVGVFCAIILFGIFDDDFYQLFLSKVPVRNMSMELLNARLRIYQVQATTAGSMYLTWMKKVDIRTVVPFTILRIIYFWLSPMPGDWRGIVDISAFMTDSIVHIAYLCVIICYVVRYIKNESDSLCYNKKDQLIIFSAVALVFLTGLIFCWGTSNAGTAVRHRVVALPFKLVVMGYLFSSEKRLMVKSN